MEEAEESPGNYLSLDGGLSALPALCTLEELLSRLRYDLKSDQELLPWRYFRVIIGTGPGGLIAIFVGRLQMTASKAIEVYTRLLPALSASPAKDDEERKRNTKAFKEAFLGILNELGYDASTPFLDEKGPKTIICTLNVSNPLVVHLVRSYQSRSAPTAPCTILEAACACVAYPDAFLPVTIGTGHKQVTLIDGMAGFSNPSRELLREAQRIFGGEAEVATLVSIGAGKGDVWNLTNAGINKDISVALKRITTNCEPIHEELYTRLRRTAVYFRLNVERGEGSQMQLSSAHVSAYLQEGDISDRLDDAIKNLKGQGCGVKLNDIDSVSPLEVRLKPRPSLVQNFVGREEVLNRMRQTHLARHSPDLRGPAITVLSGLGGSGKTQTALRFAIDFEKSYPDMPVYFLNADSEASLKADYETLIRSQGSKHSSKSHHDALTWLATKLKNWLLILDNADNPDLHLFPFIPKCAFGNVIITTRNSTHAALARSSSHHIEELSASDSVELILKTSGNPNTKLNQQYARKIGDELGHLPLALAQAAGYIFVHKCLSRYLDIYHESRGKILASTAATLPQDYPLSLAMTIQMSLDQVDQQFQDLMKLFAYMQYTSIAHSIIVKSAERRFKKQYGQRSQIWTQGPWNMLRLWVQSSYITENGQNTNLTS